MIRIDFDVPSYLRLPQGLCIVGERSRHKLPPDDQVTAVAAQATERLEQLQINRYYRPAERTEVVPAAPEPEPIPGEAFRGEFIPLDAYSEEEHADYQQDEDVVETPPNNASELSFAGKEGKSVSGVYNGSGFAHYRFNKKNGRSFYLRIGKHLIWGAELRRELQRINPKQGQTIQVTFLGKTPVTVLKENGKAGEDWVNTFRNSWKVELVK